MDLIIRNFGKIAEADIKLDGITVICGNNDSGKSTVGKALFGFFNSLNDMESKMINIKEEKIHNFLFSFGRGFSCKNDVRWFIKNNIGKITVESLKEFIDNNVFFMDDDIKVTRELLKPVAEALNVSEEDIKNESVWRYFNLIMNSQIKNVNSIRSKCSVEGKFNHSKNSVLFLKDKCECKIEETVLHKAYYISNPNLVDFIGNRNSIFQNLFNLMEKSTISAITEAQKKIDNDPMANILDVIINKDDLNEIKTVLQKAFEGSISVTKGEYIYNSEKGHFDIRNLSVGLKSFAIIERMLETGVLKRKDVLILDEPEIHLHSEWQLVYAELIVMLQKKFDLTILIVTHSFQFLKALEFFMKYYEITDRGNFYVPEKNTKGVVMRSYGNDSSELKLNLSTGDFKLSDMELKYDLDKYIADNKSSD